MESRVPYSVPFGKTSDLCKSREVSVDTEVLVVGAGPVGLATALFLSERGIRVSIVDKYQRAALGSYALALHAGTLRLLDELGVAQPLIEHGNPIETLAIRHKGVRVADIEMSVSTGGLPDLLVVSQLLLESALEQRLEDNGVQVGWNRQLLAFEADDEAVTALTISPQDVEGPSQRVRAHALIGADGVPSLTHRLLGGEFAHTTDPVQYALIEFEAAIAHPGEMSLCFDRGWTDVLWPLGPERARWAIQVPESPGETDPAMTRALVRSRHSWYAGGLDSVDWSSSVRFVPHLVRWFGRGRVWLAGDAAHFTSPVGAQSMNIGIREAADLARRLEATLRGDASPRSLYRFSSERLREWDELLGLKTGPKITRAAPPWAVELAPRLVSALPASGRGLNLLLGQVGLSLPHTKSGASRDGR